MTSIEENSACPQADCQGHFVFPPVENCSCHLSPPCHACTSNALTCAECGYVEPVEQPFNDHILKVNPKTNAILSWRPRDLDPTKVDWRSLPHSSCSMIKEGVYPLNTPKAEVYELVKGTFGGRFAHFGDGKFKFIAYTD